MTMLSTFRSVRVWSVASTISWIGFFSNSDISMILRFRQADNQEAAP